MGFTHVLLMDDDATISSAAIELNYILLSYLKPEYFGHTIGGKLLVLNVPYLQFEAGAQWNKGKIKALKNDLDIRQLDMVLLNQKLKTSLLNIQDGGTAVYHFQKLMITIFRYQYLFTEMILSMV